MVLDVGDEKRVVMVTRGGYASSYLSTLDLGSRDAWNANELVLLFTAPN